MIAIAFCFTKILALFSATVTNGQYISTAELHPNCLKVQPTERLSTEWVRISLNNNNYYSIIIIEESSKFYCNSFIV